MITSVYKFTRKKSDSSSRPEIRLIILIAAIIIVLVNSGYGGGFELQFDAGNKEYLEGNYAKALEFWEQLIDEGYQGGSLFFNTGNAYYKLGAKGKAMLYWEKSAKFLGEDEDLKTNLTIARASLTDKTETLVRLPVWNWLDNIRNRFSPMTLSWIAILACFAIFLTIGLRRWLLKKAVHKKLLKVFVWVWVWMFVLSSGFIWLNVRDAKHNQSGIIVKVEIEVLSAPTISTGKLLFTLHEGTKVKVLRKLRGWYEVEVSKDKQGWMQVSGLGVI